MSVFRNLDCLSLVFCSNTTLLKLQTVLFLFFFQILRFEMGGAAYLWMRLIHGRLRYATSKTSPYKYLFSVILLLSNDINLKPGPQKDPCCECLKGCRKNQKAIQCDECQSWFQAKCIKMSSIEYNYHLQGTDSNWSFNSCLFLLLMADSSTQLTSRSAATISVDNGSLKTLISRKEE